MRGAGEAGSCSLLILLVGGRPQPSIMLAVQLKPAVIGCVASRDSERTVTEMQETLASVLPATQLMDEPCLVSPYRVGETLNAVEDLRDAHQELWPCISVTGAPVPMTIAGYQAACSWNCPAYYVNTRDGEIIDLTVPDDPGSLRVTVSMEEYLAIYGLRIARRQHRRNRLEERVCSVADGLCGPGGVFDECDRGVVARSKDAEREIDLVAIGAGTCLIASCKGGKDPWQKQYLDEINAVAHMLGGDYCIRLFITDQPRPAPPPGGIDRIDQFMEQGRRQRVVVVSGGQLTELKNVFRKEMGPEPTFPRR